MKLNVRFELKLNYGTKPQKIRLVCCWTKNKTSKKTSENRFVYSTDYSVIPDNWDKEKKEIKGLKSEPFAKRTNRQLDLLRHEVYNLFLKSEEEHIPLTKEYLKSGLDKHTGKIVPEKKLSFLEFVEKYVEASKTRLNLKTGKIISFRTVQELKKSYDNLKEFEATKKHFDWQDISVPIFKEYIKFISPKYKKNSLKKQMMNVKQFLNAAQMEKFEFDYVVVNSKDLNVSGEVVQKVALTEKELQRFEDLELKGTEEKVRDLFLFAVWAGGLRVSDWNISSDNLTYRDEGVFLTVIHKKTGRRVVLPYFSMLKKLLEKWDFKMPKLSDQKINDYLKIISKKAGLFDKIQVSYTKGGKNFREVKEKWEMVASHCARRTFITTMIKKGYPQRSVMKLAGQVKESTFLKYLIMDDMDYAVLMRPITA